jgi:hypothetical protein
MGETCLFQQRLIIIIFIDYVVIRALRGMQSLRPSARCVVTCVAGYAEPTPVLRLQHSIWGEPLFNRYTLYQQLVFLMRTTTHVETIPVSFPYGSTRSVVRIKNTNNW